MAGVSFVAYAAIRIFGPSRGLILASVGGTGLLHRDDPPFGAVEQGAPAGALRHAGAALLAGAVMGVRLSAIAAVLAPALFRGLVAPLGAFAGLSAIMGLAAALRPGTRETGQGESPMKSPFDLGLIFKFVLVLGAVMATARVLSALYGDHGGRRRDVP